MPNKYAELIEELIYIKDTLKEDGYGFWFYEPINKACNALEQEGKK